MTRKQTSSADRKRYDVLHEMLRERQVEIHNKLRSLRQVLPAEVAEVKDAEEQSMEDFVRGMDFALMEMESETLRRIDEAMLRLQAGTYGVCAECDTTIAEARLRALPFATLCRDCQEQTEEATRTSRPRVDFDAEPAVPARGRRPASQPVEKPKLGPWGVRAAQNA
jgi:RNA polymerase-binding transcription factor